MKQAEPGAVVVAPIVGIVTIGLVVVAPVITGALVVVTGTAWVMVVTGAAWVVSHTILPQPSGHLQASKTLLEAS